MTTTKLLLYAILIMHLVLGEIIFSKGFAQTNAKSAMNPKLILEAISSDQINCNFKNRSYVLDSGGDIANSPSYRTLHSIGQPSPVAISRSISFINHPGFIPTIRNKFKITGKTVYALGGKCVANVTMFLSGAESAQVNTSNTGYYELGNLEDGLSYLVMPQKYGDYIKALTITLTDAFRVYSYLNNSLDLSDDELWASDIDENGVVDQIDELFIRKRVFSNSDTVTNHSGQWRFRPGRSSYSPLVSDTTNQNYKSVILGDNNGSWQCLESSLSKEPIKEIAYSGFNDIKTNYDSTVTIPLSMQNKICFQFAEIKLYYDPKILSFTECQQTGLIENLSMMTLIDTCKGEISIALLASHAIDLEGELLLMKFKVLGNEGDISRLVLQKFRINDGSIMKASAKLTIVSPTELPRRYQLYQNFPNPFNSITIIPYDLANSIVQRTELKVYNIRGQKVKTVVDRIQPGGFYKVSWDGTNDAGEAVASGVYVYRLSSGFFNKTNKLLILK